MKIRWAFIGILGLLGLGLWACTQPAGEGPGLAPMSAKPQEARRYLVVFRAETLPAGARAWAEGQGARVLKALEPIGTMVVQASPQAAQRLARDPRVLSVGVEHRYALPKREMVLATEETYGAPTPADSLYRWQWDIRRIKAPEVWARIPLEAQAQATVAILDTGVMDNHPDLQGQIVDFVATNYCQEVGGPSATPSYPKYSLWIDFDRPIDPENLCTPAPSVMYEAHGTHVAGTVAARFGGGRVVGVAPGLRLAAYKVFDRIHYTVGNEEVDDVGAFDGPIFEAILDAAQKGYAVINMSLGGTLDTRNREDVAALVAWDRVMKYANQMGTVIVASAGNAGENANGVLVHIPSDLPTVISVSATGTATPLWQYPYPTPETLNAEPGQDVLAFYSNYGAAVDLAAPGGDCGLDENGVTWCARPSNERPAGWRYHLILSTVIVNETTPAYAWYAGTSMASPHVAAVAGLVKALHPTWTPGEVRAHLKATAENLGQRQLFGHGLVDADRAAR
ncbi:S8 family peptidase [Thermus oshimai]